MDKPTTPNAAQLYNATWLNVAGAAARSVISAAKAIGMVNVPVWMGEGSPDWKAEESALGRNFTFEFAWLDMLGQMAENGVKRAYRQTVRSVVGGSELPPAYYMSFLWRTLVLSAKDSVPVRRVVVIGSSSSSVRAYALGDVVILLNTDRWRLRRVRVKYPGWCRKRREEWHCMGGADVAPGVHGILVNGKQPTFEGGGPRFARPAVVECEEAIVVGPGAVMFVQASDNFSK